MVNGLRETGSGLRRKIMDTVRENEFTNRRARAAYNVGGENVLTASLQEEEFVAAEQSDTTAEERFGEDFKGGEKKIYLAAKRLFDIVCAALATVVLSPFFLVIAIIIKAEDPKGPVFFAHQRIGMYGKTIRIYKFRSMVSNAEELIEHFTPEQRKEYEENYKLENDPRITKIGNFLRKSSLDELPQLLNILSGTLSIVGPRPVVHNELEKYGAMQEKFLSVKPGLTGYWQANGRSDTTYDERMAMELYYADNCSFLLDIKIIFKTITVVLTGQGAK